MRYDTKGPKQSLEQVFPGCEQNHSPFVVRHRVLFLRVRNLASAFDLLSGSHVNMTPRLKPNIPGFLRSARGVMWIINSTVVAKNFRGPLCHVNLDILCLTYYFVSTEQPTIEEHEKLFLCLEYSVHCGKSLGTRTWPFLMQTCGNLGIVSLYTRLGLRGGLNYY